MATSKETVKLRSDNTELIKKVKSLEDQARQLRNQLKHAKQENIKLRGSDLSLKRTLELQIEQNQSIDEQIAKQKAIEEELRKETRRLKTIAKIHSTVLGVKMKEKNAQDEESIDYKRKYAESEAKILELKSYIQLKEESRKKLIKALADRDESIENMNDELHTSSRTITDLYQQIAGLKQTDLDNTNLIFRLQAEVKRITNDMDKVDVRNQELIQNSKRYTILLRQISCHHFIRQSKIRKYFLDLYHNIAQISLSVDVDILEHQTPQSQSAVEFTPRTSLKRKHKLADTVYQHSLVSTDLADMCIDESMALYEKIKEQLSDMNSLRTTINNVFSENVIHTENLAALETKLKDSHEEIVKGKQELRIEKKKCKKIEEKEAELLNKIDELENKIKQTETNHKKEMLRCTVHKNKVRVQAMSAFLSSLNKSRPYDDVNMNDELKSDPTEIPASFLEKQSPFLPSHNIIPTVEQQETNIITKQQQQQPKTPKTQIKTSKHGGNKSGSNTPTRVRSVGSSPFSSPKAQKKLVRVTSYKSSPNLRRSSGEIEKLEIRMMAQLPSLKIDSPATKDGLKREKSWGKMYVPGR